MLPNGSASYHDFSRDRNNRFDTPERASKNRIIQPTTMLHFYNVPKIDDGDLIDLFTSTEAPCPNSVKWLPSKSEKSASGILGFKSVKEACEALAIVNHTKINGSFKPFEMKLCFSPANKHLNETV